MFSWNIMSLNVFRWEYQAKVGVFLKILSTKCRTKCLMFPGIPSNLSTLCSSFFTSCFEVNIHGKNKVVHQKYQWIMDGTCKSIMRMFTCSLSCNENEHCSALYLSVCNNHTEVGIQWRSCNIWVAHFSILDVVLSLCCFHALWLMRILQMLKPWK